MANIDELFGGFDDPIGFDESETINPVVVAIEDDKEKEQNGY